MYGFKCYVYETKNINSIKLKNYKVIIIELGKYALHWGVNIMEKKGRILKYYMPEFFKNNTPVK